MQNNDQTQMIATATNPITAPAMIGALLGFEL
jgi:hypothetical protein